jgi:hypothetical protein
MPVSGGPYLQAAFFCEKALREADGVFSFIRAVDRWNIVGQSPTMIPTIIQATLVAMFKSGTFRASVPLVITPISPTNERMPPIIMPVLFEGDDERGGGVVLPMGFQVQEPGLYWFEVAITLPGEASAVMTFIPMRVVYMQTALPMMPPVPNAGQH